jgi:hypothetical protein
MQYCILPRQARPHRALHHTHTHACMRARPEQTYELVLFLVPRSALLLGITSRAWSSFPLPRQFRPRKMSIPIDNGNGNGNGTITRIHFFKDVDATPGFLVIRSLARPFGLVALGSLVLCGIPVVKALRRRRRPERQQSRTTLLLLLGNLVCSALLFMWNLSISLSSKLDDVFCDYWGRTGGL